MKKVLSLIAILAILICGVVSVSAEISPGPTTPQDYIKVDVIPFPENAGDADCDEKGYIHISSDELVTITATAKEGYKFSHWEFITGQYTIVEGKLTDPVMVIDPTGNESLLIYAHFVKEGEPVTDPTTKPSQPIDDGSQSPTTGDPRTVTFIVFSVAAVFTVFAVVVVLRKRFN